MMTPRGDEAEARDTATGPLPARAPRPRRELSVFDWIVRVPPGFVWLVVLTLLTVPVTIGMTLLYYAVHGARALAAGLRVSRRGPAGDPGRFSG